MNPIKCTFQFLDAAVDGQQKKGYFIPISGQVVHLTAGVFRVVGVNYRLQTLYLIPNTLASRLRWWWLTKRGNLND